MPLTIGAAAVSLLRVVNLLWYIVLTPVWALILLLTCFNTRERVNRVYCGALRLVVGRSAGGADTFGRWCTSANVDDGVLPLSVVLALCLPPIYVYGLAYQSDTAFLIVQTPLLLLFYLVCSDSCHYESHLWQARCRSDVRSRSGLHWYHRMFGLRMMQYALSPFYPLPQHIPHLLVHHRINMANGDDVDWNGDLRRDSLTDFLQFLSRFDWRTYLHGARYIRQRAERGGVARFLYRHYCLDLALTLGTYAVCFYLSPSKGVFQYALHSLLNYRLAWVTFFLEHPFHHANAAGTYDHPFHATTLFDANGVASDSHAAHHHLGMRSIAQNAAWGNSAQFALDQLRHRNIALRLETRIDEWLRIPYYACTRNYVALHRLVYFIPREQLAASGQLTAEQLDAYARFQADITPEVIRARMQKRWDGAAQPLSSSNLQAKY